MTFATIEKLADGNEDILRSLTFGYLRGCDEKQLAEMLKKEAYTKYIGGYIFRCLLENCLEKTADDVALHFLKLSQKSPPYPQMQRNGMYLDRIYGHCSLKVRKQIAEFFLNSGKRYLRKYAYAKPLYELGDNIPREAWAIASSQEDEISFLAKTIAYQYPEDKLEAWQKVFMSNPGIEEYQVRKFFSRKKNLSASDWKWMKENIPTSYLYLSALNQRRISDEDCSAIYKGALKAKPSRLYTNLDDFSMFEGQPEYDGFLLWCLARLKKWQVIENALPKNRKKAQA